MSVLPARNLELKARVDDLGQARAAALALDARVEGRFRQIDSYFRVPHGRLKLREVDGRDSELIWYARPDRGATRTSAYHVVPVAHAAGLKAALSAALELRGTVSKLREVLLWHNVRIHLDDVCALGRFVEFEAVIGNAADEAASPARLDLLREALEIRDGDVVGVSYCDLVGI